MVVRGGPFDLLDGLAALAHHDSHLVNLELINTQGVLEFMIVFSF